MILPAPIVAEVGYLLAKFGSARTEAGFLASLADGDFVVEELTARNR